MRPTLFDSIDFTGAAQPFGGGGGASPAAAASERPVAEVMTTMAPAVPPWLQVRAARQIAALKSAEHLLIEEEGRLVGVLALRDLEPAAPEDPIAAWVQRPALFVGPDTSAARAREMMVKNRASCLPVIAGAFLVGLVTRQALERALARPVAAGGRGPKRRRLRGRRAAA